MRSLSREVCLSHICKYTYIVNFLHKGGLRTHGQTSHIQEDAHTSTVVSCMGTGPIHGKTSNRREVCNTLEDSPYTGKLLMHGRLSHSSPPFISGPQLISRRPTFQLQPYPPRTSTRIQLRMDLEACTGFATSPLAPLLLCEAARTGGSCLTQCSRGMEGMPQISTPPNPSNKPSHNFQANPKLPALGDHPH